MKRSLHLALAGTITAGLGLAACGPNLVGARYAFIANGPPTRDLCGLAPKDGSLWGGDLVITGSQLRLDSTLDGLRFLGQFKTDVSDEPQAFTLDGTGRDVTAQLATSTCAANFVSGHIDGRTTARDSFEGELTVVYQLAAARPGEVACPSTCELAAPFRAVRVFVP